MPISWCAALGIRGTGLAALGLPRLGGAAEGAAPGAAAPALNPFTSAARVLRLAHVTECHAAKYGSGIRWVDLGRQRW